VTPDPVSSDEPGRGSASGPHEREPETTEGAPYPPAQTQSDGPERRAPRVPSSDDEPDETEHDPTDAEHDPSGDDDA
jgi:hypothetical protein